MIVLLLKLIQINMSEKHYELRYNCKNCNSTHRLTIPTGISLKLYFLNQKPNCNKCGCPLAG